MQKPKKVQQPIPQKKELYKRLTDHKAGKLKYYTIDEVRKTVFKAIKK